MQIWRAFSRWLRTVPVVCAAALCLAASAQAISKPISIGSNTKSAPSTPAVAVDPVGNLYTAWMQPGGKALKFCELAVGATKCKPVVLGVPDPSHAEFFDPPSVLVNGAGVYVFEEVDGASST